jgi:hypothetical protein
VYKAARKIHLWVGLVLAAVVLVEALTGLILAEPWLVGHDSARPQQQSAGLQNHAPLKATASGIEGTKPAADGFNIVGFAKGLHRGKVYGFDLKWLIDLTAVGLIVLVVTGVLIAKPMLLARNRRQ